MERVNALYRSGEAVRKHWVEKTFEHPSGIARKIALEHIQHIVQPNSHVLDLGCGAGTPSALIADMVPQGKVIGIDSSAAMLAAATGLNKDNLSFMHGEVTRVPCENESFNLVTSFMVLHNLTKEDIQRVFSETSRVLRPGGRSIFLTIHPDFLNCDFDMDCMAYRPEDLRRYRETEPNKREGIELWGQAMNFDGSKKDIMMIYHGRDTIIDAATENNLQLIAETPITLTTEQLQKMYGREAVRKAPSQPIFWIIDLEKK